MSLRLAILLTLASGAFGCADDVSTTLVKRAEQASDKVAAVAPKVKENDIDQQSNSKYPLITVDTALICNDISFINSDGDLKQGTKECSEAVSCTSDGQANCLANSSFPAAAAQNLADKVLTGQTVAGVSGNASLAPICNIEGQTACLALGPTYVAVAIAGAGDKIISGQSVAGVAGNVVIPAATKVLVGTAFGVNGTSMTGTLTLPLAANVLAASGSYGEAGAQLVPSYTPDFPDLANVRSIDSVGGVAGTLTNCSTGNQTGCVTTATVKSMDVTAASVMTDLTSLNFNATAASAANFEFWDSTGTRHQVAGDADLSAANILSGVAIFGIAGSVTAAPANCSSNGSQNCVATGSYYAATACASNGADTCYVNPAGSYDAADLSNLTAANIKRGVSIAGTTGNFPSATSALPRYSDSGATTGTTGSDETDLTNFITQLTSAGTFEYWDSSGIRRTGSGDSDLVNANIKNAIAIESLSLTGSYAATLSCPTGWIMVPGDSDYGTGNFCVMKYEAKNVSTVATSQASLDPWADITQTASITACRALGTGYDMISNPQWMTIGANVAGINGNWTGGTVGSGNLFAGHNDNSPASSCAASSNDSLFYVETDCTPVSSGDTTDQRRTHTLSNSTVIWDLPGNVIEWVNYINLNDKPGNVFAQLEYTAVTGTTTTALKDLIPTNAVKAFWSDAWNSGKSIGTFYPGTNFGGGALRRGRSWLSGSTTSGVFAAMLDHSPSDSGAYLGFRCTSSPSP